MAKHRNSPHLAFWKMLKKGNDHFEVSKLEPRVNVCEKRYVFDAQSPGDPSRPLTFSAQAKCPVYEVDAEIASAVQQKEQRDDARFAELVRRNVATVPIKTNADGGMHPVFVAAVKRNQVGVAPSSSFLASTAPGTIPPTVRPPRIPELADAGVVPAAHSNGEVPPPQMAIADTSSSTPQTTAKPTNFFSSLFASKSSETKAAETKATEKKSDGALDRMARLVGLRKGEPKTENKPADAAKPKPAAAKPAQPAPSTANGAIRPKPAEAPVKTAEAQPPAPAPAASNPFPPAPQRAPAPAAAAPANGGGLSGAAPVVPSGNFDSRWSAFR
jgi:hypothetical protein